MNRRITRRDFVKSGAYAVLAGAGSALFYRHDGFAVQAHAGQSSAGSSGMPQSVGLDPAGAGKPAMNPNFEPPYLELHRSGELRRRADHLWSILESCEICPRRCRVNRIEGTPGFCGASSDLIISSYHAHFGEERPLVGRGGSGTIFFSHCSLRCVFCINWETSHEGIGGHRSVEDLAAMMLALQRRGCHNINVVTPTHYSPHILRALDLAAARGLSLPLVYNTCGWEQLNILKQLDGIVDIYLADFKYDDPKMAGLYSAGAESYPSVTRAALLEMHRQVGVAHPDSDGLMRRGLMIRHLVMPNRVGGTRGVVRWIAENLPKDTYLNIMSQYRPMHRAHEHPDISRRPTIKEYAEAVRWAREAGLTNLDIQG
jgi:putative pyruvate formate lyase activating enzyme